MRQTVTHSSNNLSCSSVDRLHCICLLLQPRQALLDDLIVVTVVTVAYLMYAINRSVQKQNK